MTYRKHETPLEAWTRGLALRDIREEKIMSQSSCNNPDRHRDITYTQDLVRDTPDIRKERVAAAKRALHSGTLKLKGEELADKLLDDPLHQSE
jgi:anti-sigma28 factor (negative regulator of flagellin synthesis)